jgi:hypothetical protein
MDEFNGDAQARGRDFRFQQVRYAYRRVALGVAVDYVLDLALVYRRFTGGSSRDPKKTTMKTVPVRRHVYVRQHFGPPVVLTDREQLLLLLKQRSSKNNNSDEDVRFGLYLCQFHKS